MAPGRGRKRCTASADPELCAEISLSRREREIMHVLYKLGRASGQEIRRNLANGPSYSTVRTILAVLERKSWVRHVGEGLRYIYTPVIPRSVAANCALKLLVQTFFDSSPKEAIRALITGKMFQLKCDELEELCELLQQARIRRRETL